MDGQNFGKDQNNSYQDYTANVPYQSSSNSEVNDSGKASGIQIASLVLGILSICLCCCYGLPSIILGIIGLVCAIKGNKENKHGIGIAGLVCSIIGLIAGVCMLIYYVVVIGLMLSSGFGSYSEFLDSLYY